MVAALLLSGCGDSGSESTLPIAGRSDILGPYRLEPFRAFDQAAIGQLQEKCAKTLDQALDAAPQLVLADGRGGGRLVLVFVGPAGTMADCVGRLTNQGEAFVEATGRTTLDAPALEPDDLIVASGGQPIVGNWEYRVGRAGDNVGRVAIEMDDGTEVEASLGGGWYAAWWADGNAVGTVAYDRDGAQVAELPDP
jgi:hypothetical protein